MLKAREPFKTILMFFFLFGFTSKKLSLARRVSSTIIFVLFGVTFWILIILSIAQHSESRDITIYVLVAPTIFGMLLKSIKLFSNFKDIDDLFDSCEVIFSDKSFQPHLDRALRKAKFISYLQMGGFLFLWVVGCVSTAVRRKFSVPMFLIGDTKDYFWFAWAYEHGSGVLSTSLLAHVNLLPICLLLVFHEYIIFMNDFVMSFSRFNHREKLKQFIKLQSEFKM